MGFIEKIYEKAKENIKIIAVPECTNEIMMRASYKVASDGIADIVFIGNKSEIEDLAKKNGIDLSIIKVVDLNDADYKEEIVEKYITLPYTFLGKKSIISRMSNPLYMALVMQAVGDVDTTFAGLDATTGEVVLAASAIIGLAEGVPTASCFFAVELESFEGKENYFIGMSDGGVTVDPTPEQLAGIAISCCDTFQALKGDEAKCALLSFSTLGSGNGPQVEKVVKAREIANQLRPDLIIDGEFQVDAALSERSAKKKVKRESKVAGQANLLVFPNIESCNIGSKMVQMTSNCKAYGPILQGFRLPVCDCSRSDTEDRLYNNMACSSVLASYIK